MCDAEKFHFVSWFIVVSEGINSWTPVGENCAGPLYLEHFLPKGKKQNKKTVHPFFSMSKKLKQEKVNLVKMNALYSLNYTNYAFFW